jgi:hypothetical protein
MIFDQQMTICRRTVNAAAFVALLIFSTNGGQISAATQNMRQHRFRPDVQDHKNRSVKVLWQMLVKLAKGFHSARRSADNNNITFGHGKSRPS